MTMTMATRPRRMTAAIVCLTLRFVESASPAGSETKNDDNDNDPCLLYLAQSTIPNAGLGVFAGTFFKTDELVGRVGDAAFPTVDQNWHLSSEDGSVSKAEGDFHWPLANYDWNAPDIGCEWEAEDISVTVAGFGAAPNCHFRLINIKEHKASYDNGGLDRHKSPGAGASTPWFNRSSTALWDIEAGSELFVDYGQDWFLTRDGVFQLVPVADSFENAQSFLKEYGKLLVGSTNPNDLIEEKMALDEEARRDLWNIIKSFPYVTRERQALPVDHNDAVRAIHGDIQAIEKENSKRSVEYLEEHGKCMDNIVPGKSEIPHAGRGAFATRFIPKGGLVAPAPVVHIADKATTNMYNEKIGRQGNVVRDGTAVVAHQIILNYMFGHPNSTVLLFPYSSNVAYINHHATEYNAEVRWAKDFSFFHKEEWLSKPVDFLEEQWTSGLMLEFIALRDIEAGEEVLINYGAEWQAAWDEHVRNWRPSDSDTLWSHRTEKKIETTEYVRADALNNDVNTPIRTMEEQINDPYHSSIEFKCFVNVNHDSAYRFAPLTTPYFRREWDRKLDMRDDSDDIHHNPCNITMRYGLDDDDDSEDDTDDEDEADHADHEQKQMYTITLDVKKQVGDMFFSERHEITDVPREAIAFVNLPYSSDIFLKNAFRHEMILPDDLLPKAWMNVINEQ